jgi:hypothetical protein
MASKFIKFTGVNFWNQLEERIVKNLKIGFLQIPLKGLYNFDLRIKTLILAIYAYSPYPSFVSPNDNAPD